MEHKLAPLLYDDGTDWNAIRNHSTDKVITIGRDSLGWVDLWWGILVCSFLNDEEEEEPVVSLMELPDPMPGNEDQFGKSSAPSCRDIICVNGDQIRLVEVDYHRSAHGVSLGYASTDFGWKARSWSRTLSSEDWHDCFEVDTDEIPMTDEVYSCLFPGPQDDEKVDKPSLRRLICYAPTLSIEDNILYMMSKLTLDPRNPVAWLAAVDMGNKALELVSVTDEIASRCNQIHLSCGFSKFLR